MEFKLNLPRPVIASIHVTAMNRAEACIRRGDAKGAAHWMTVADRSHRIEYRWRAFERGNTRDTDARHGSSRQR